jgi:carboxyl-terminal processing protease
MKKLRGPRGTRVKVSILRRGVPGLLDFEITRDQIPIYSVDAAYMLTSTTGYVKISSFSRTTHEEFVSAADKLHQQGMKRIIVDLRGNGGGYMESATSVADEFSRGMK